MLATPEEEEKYIGQYKKRIETYLQYVSDHWDKMEKIITIRERVKKEASREYRKGGFTKEVKEKVIERDKYACRECDRTDQRLDVHHSQSICGIPKEIVIFGVL